MSHHLGKLTVHHPCSMDKIVIIPVKTRLNDYTGCFTISVVPETVTTAFIDVEFISS
jgi:hypothetical protein